MKKNPDHCNFAWHGVEAAFYASSILAISPRYFIKSSMIEVERSPRLVASQIFQVTNYGVHIFLPIISCAQLETVKLHDMCQKNAL